MTEKKKILITIDWFDPAYKAGGPVISIVKLIENLSDLYEFYVLTGSVDYGDTSAMPGIVPDQWTDWKGKAKVYYLSEQNRTRKKVFEILDETAANIYYIQGVFSPYFSIYPLIWWHQAKEDKVIIATRGMFHTSALNVKRRKKMLYLYAAKIMGWFHHVKFHSTNPEETVQLKKILGNEASYAEASNFPRILEFQPEKHKKQSGELKLLSVARISPEKNSLFLLDIMAEVKSAVSLTVVGNYGDEAYFAQFKKKMESMPAHVKVEYAGHKIINELQAYYDSNHVFVLPTTGENFGHSIIEALSSGMPCLISANTPWNQLGESGCGANLPMDAAAYAREIDHYFEMNESDFSKQVQASRHYAESRINLQKTRESYIKLFE